MQLTRTLLLFILVAAFARPVFAAGDVTTKSLDIKSGAVESGETYISPFLERDRLNIIAMGDWLAHGVWWGMYDRFKKDRSVNYRRHSRYTSGFARPRSFDWNKRLSTLVARQRIDIAVVSFGMNDGRDIYTSGKILPFNTPKWRDVYTSRVDQFIITLKQHGAAVYWLGLPIVRDAKTAEKNKILNGIYKQLARKNEIKFIGSWHEFADKQGQFTFAGVDINDRPKLLRTNDGKHFTMAGYRKLGKLMDMVISADISAMDAASKTSLKGAREKEIKLKTPGGRDNGSLTPEFKAELDAEGAQITSINQGVLITGSVRRAKASLDAYAYDPGKNRDTMTPASIKIAKKPEVKIVSPDIRPVDNSLASPEVAILFEGGHLAAKPGRDDDYSWPR